MARTIVAHASIVPQMTKICFARQLTLDVGLPILLNVKKLLRSQRAGGRQEYRNGRPAQHEAT
jgi:hypothetical protein